VAHSFVRSKEDVLAVQEVLDQLGSPMKIIAKIENQEGVDNADEILEVAYGIMIARGDLGIEVAQEKIPGIQRTCLSAKAIHHKKPVIVATQMLHSMIQHPRPTRAEITDIANAIYYRTDAVMLSGETAYGKYPVEAVRTMARTAREAEKTKLGENDIRVPYTDDDREVTEFLAKQAVKSQQRLNVKAIVTDSHTGRTARVMAAFRGKKPVYAICHHQATGARVGPILRYMGGVSRGERVMAIPKRAVRAYFSEAIRRLIDKKMIEPQRPGGVPGGQPSEKTGGTTYLEIVDAWRVLEAKETL
jgi:pyruvate kinase